MPDDYSHLWKLKYQKNCLISVSLPGVNSRKGRIRSLPLFKLLIPVPGENHTPMFFFKKYVFLCIQPVIHSARASKHIRTLIYNTYAYVVESLKILRTNLPMENRPYGAHWRSEHNWSPLSPLAPSPSMMKRIFG